MSFVDVHIVNAFVDAENGGNPAGVVIDADNLSTQQKLSIASTVGLSETAFVSASAMADFKLDFFTPNKQIAHCGHATVATFAYLNQLNKVPTPQTSKETIDGVRKILIRNDEIFLEQTAPKYTSASESKTNIASTLGLDPDELSGVYNPFVVNTGNSWLVIPLKDAASLKSIKTNTSVIRELSEKYDCIGYYVFATQSNQPGRDATIRMFAPRYGIEEESATGTAASTLAAYMHDIMKVRQSKFNFEQGYYMTPPLPSLLTVELEISDGKIERLLVGGKASFGKSLRIEY